MQPTVPGLGPEGPARTDTCSCEERQRQGEREREQQRRIALKYPEGPYILPPWNKAPKDHPHNGFGGLIPY